MDELETLRLKTIQRYFWASISVGGTLGYLLGSNLADNLIVLCSSCHDQLHAGRLQLPDSYKPA
ncbi:HNH endonuclease [Candidatus Sumerlaeota bacterium]|nr:HNH endonuclease [Candidatus Sumerlaeota bacterium]